MTTFTLDTSGVVQRVILSNQPGGNVFADGTWRWSDLDPFTQGYVEALFASFERWPSTALGDAKYPALHNADGKGVTIGLGFRDLAPETLAAILADCAALVSPPHVFRYGADTGAKCWRMRQEGWHLYPGGPSLRAIFPPLTVRLGDDGKVRLS